MAKENKGCVVVGGVILTVGGAMVYGLANGVNETMEPLTVAVPVAPTTTQVITEAMKMAVEANVAEFAADAEKVVIGLLAVAIPVALVWIWRRSQPRRRLKGEATLGVGPYKVSIATTHPGAILPGMSVKMEQEHPLEPGVYIPPTEAERITDLVRRAR